LQSPLTIIVAIPQFLSINSGLSSHWCQVIWLNGTLYVTAEIQWREVIFISNTLILMLVNISG
jgi:hypothetical protein